MSKLAVHMIIYISDECTSGWEVATILYICVLNLMEFPHKSMSYTAQRCYVEQTEGLEPQLWSTAKRSAVGSFKHIQNYLEVSWVGATLGCATIHVSFVENRPERMRSTNHLCPTYYTLIPHESWNVLLFVIGIVICDKIVCAWFLVAIYSYQMI